MTGGWRRIAGLDGLRGIAVLMVFIDHRLPGANVRYVGGYAVHIFFVLSGFLIIGMLHRDQLDVAAGGRSASQAWRDFMIRRAARILPLYYLILAILVTLSLRGLGAPFGGRELAFYGLFLTNVHFVLDHHWGPFPQSWSLAIEEQFYLLAAPLLLAVSPRATWRICLVTAVLAAAWNFWLALHVPTSLAVGLDSFSNFGPIALGGAFALRHRASSPGLARWVQPILLLGLLLIPFLPDGASNPVIRQVAQPLLAALLLAEIRDHGDTPLVRMLETRGFIHLGEISYGLYLIHQFITPNLISRMTGGLLNITAWTPVGAFLPLFVVSAGLASCSRYWLERPIILAAKRFIAGQAGTRLEQERADRTAGQPA